MQATIKLQTDMVKVAAGVDMTAPAAFYAALFTSDPTEMGYQTNEVSYTGYARQAVAFSYSNSSTATSGYIYHNSQITFPTVPRGSTGTVTHVGILDAATGGNMLLFAPLAEAVPLGDIVKLFFTAQSLKWILSGVIHYDYRQKFFAYFSGTSITGFTAYIGLASTSGQEKSSSGYARQQMQMELVTGTPIRIQNSSDLSFPEASVSWGEVGQVLIWDASSGGRRFAVFTLDDPISVTQGSQVRVDAHKIVVRMHDPE